MNTTRQRLLCSPQSVNYRVTAADSSQGRSAHTPPLVVANWTWSVHHVAARPGRAGGHGLRPAPLAAPGVPTTSNSDRLQEGLGLQEAHPAAHHGMKV